MGALLAFAIPVLPAWAWELIIIILKQVGLISWASAVSLQLYVFLAKKLKSVKTYHENNDFPHPFPGITNQHNFVTGQKP